MTTTPISDLALLSDRHSAALVDRDGAVQWLAFPRFDSPSVVGGLLGAQAGVWRIGPAGDEVRTERHYLEGTLVLETTFRTPTGVAVLTEAMATGEDADPHALGRSAQHLLLRRIECLEGSTEIEVRFVPRPEYGLVVPLFEVVPGGLVARGGADRFALTSPVDLTLRDGEARAVVRLAQGQALTFALHHGSLGDARPRTWSQDELVSLLEGTIASWRAWSGIHQTYQGPWQDLVHASGRVLQALSFAPTGAIVAAATPRSRRASAASGTGTTATHGCGTRASPCRRSGSRPARTRRSTSSPS